MGRGGSAAGIIFDLDGVLIDTEGLQYEAYGQVLAEFGVHLGREEYARHWIAAGNGAEYAVAAYALPLTPAELRARKNPVYHAILRRRAALMPAAPAALARLGRRFPLALATNSNVADVSFVLDHFSLRPHFRAVITREGYARAKPEPDAFLAAAAALERPPAACLVVEDAHRGVLAAHRAGARCVAIPHELTAGSDFSLADRVLGGLDELTVELAEEILAAPR